MPTCKKCQEHFSNSAMIDGKFKRLSRRNCCLKCSPFGNHGLKLATKLEIESLDGTKVCPKCHLSLNSTMFYIQRRKSGNVRLSGYCKKCTFHVTLQRQRDFKKDCISYKGGKCQDCHFIGYEGVFDFHHTDPTQKDFDISRYRSAKINKIVRLELDKCALLCANCHRIRHAKDKGII